MMRTVSHRMGLKNEEELPCWFPISEIRILVTWKGTSCSLETTIDTISISSVKGMISNLYANWMAFAKVTDLLWRDDSFFRRISVHSNVIKSGDGMLASCFHIPMLDNYIR